MHTRNAPSRYRCRQGYTFIEMLIVLAIIGFVGIASLVSFIGSRRTRDLTTAGQNAISVLRVAQSKTLAREDNSQWGVHLAPTTFTLFRGTNYASATYTQNFLLPDSVEIANIALNGGGNDIVFQTIFGTTAQFGIFDIRIKTLPSQLFSITIDGSGKVYQTATIPSPLGTRIIDLRHRSFVLGWSIQTATTLTLTFSNPPDPDIIYNIVMAPYFDVPKTKFDWSGTVTVGYQNQTLRIHTISLSGSNTTLHVDRDCRKNSKKLKIAIDTNDIATYEADCKTITVWPSGGSMSEP